MIVIMIVIMMMRLSRKEEAADNDAASIGSYYAQTHPIITRHPHPRPHLDLMLKMAKSQPKKAKIKVYMLQRNYAHSVPHHPRARPHLDLLSFQSDLRFCHYTGENKFIMTTIATCNMEASKSQHVKRHSDFMTP